MSRNITITKLNENKVAITNYLRKYVKSKIHFNDNINIMTGKTTWLNRANYGFAHLRYGDTYIYYTTSTTTDTKTDLQKKIEEDLSDVCFNIREEVLTAPIFSDQFRILVDTGTHLIDVDRIYCKAHIVETHEYRGNRVVTIRLPRGFKNKARLQNKVEVQFDAKYLQHISYSGARSKKGLLKVNIKAEDNEKTYFFKSVGDFMRKTKNVVEKTESYVQKVANRKGSIKNEGLTFQFEYVDMKTNDNGSKKVNSPELRANVKIVENKAQVIVNNKINNNSSQYLRSNSSDVSQDNYYDISSFKLINLNNININLNNNNVIGQMTKDVKVNRIETVQPNNKLYKAIKSAYKPLISRDKELAPDWYEEELN